MESAALGVKRTVLVIEDDALVANLLIRILEREGYQVTLASDGASAQHLIQTQDPAPDLVLLDLSLPYIDGLTLLADIGKAPSWAATRTIVLSGKTQEQEIRKALVLGAEDYVTKPFQLGELLARVHRALRKK